MESDADSTPGLVMECEDSDDTPGLLMECEDVPSVTERSTFLISVEKDHNYTRRSCDFILGRICDSGSDKKPVKIMTFDSEAGEFKFSEFKARSVGDFISTKKGLRCSWVTVGVDLKYISDVSRHEASKEHQQAMKTEKALHQKKDNVEFTQKLPAIDDYLKKVEETIEDKVFQKFLLNLLHYFSNKSDAVSFIRTMNTLFKRNHGLLEGLNLFLPDLTELGKNEAACSAIQSKIYELYKASCDKAKKPKVLHYYSLASKRNQEKQIHVRKMEDAKKYFSEVLEVLGGSTVRELLQLLHNYKWGKISLADLTSMAKLLLQEHPALFEGFSSFFGQGDVIMPSSSTSEQVFENVQNNEECEVSTLNCEPKPGTDTFEANSPNERQGKIDHLKETDIEAIRKIYSIDDPYVSAVTTMGVANDVDTKSAELPCDIIKQESINMDAHIVTSDVNERNEFDCVSVKTEPVEIFDTVADDIKISTNELSSETIETPSLQPVKAEIKECYPSEMNTIVREINAESAESYCEINKKSLENKDLTNYLNTHSDKHHCDDIHKQLLRQVSVEPKQLYPTETSFSGNNMETMFVELPCDIITGERQAQQNKNKVFDEVVKDPLSLEYTGNSDIKKEAVEELHSVDRKIKAESRDTVSSKQDSVVKPKLVTEPFNCSSNSNVNYDDCSRGIEIKVENAEMEIAAVEDLHPLARNDTVENTDSDSSRNIKVHGELFERSGHQRAHQRIPGVRYRIESPPAEHPRMQGMRYRIERPTPNDCRYCEKSFQKKSQLQRHVRIHTGERPFRCKLCEKSFNQKNALQIHQNTHSGDRPHKCLFCNSTFTQKGNLKVHVKRVHLIPLSAVKSTETLHTVVYCGAENSGTQNLQSGVLKHDVC